MAKIRVALAGVGNCASALVQGVYFYAEAGCGKVPGLLHYDFGGYMPGDIEFVAAFDVDGRKVGKDLADAIFQKPNNTRVFYKPPRTGVVVQRAPTLDGLGRHLKTVVEESGEKPVDVVDVLKSVNADVLVNYVPVGSERAARFYAAQALEAGCGFVNAMPAFIASSKTWQRRFRRARLPLAGDDVMSQIGATVLHKSIVKLLVDRGVEVLESYQLNIGGDMDFLNMLDEDRLKTKRISKTMAVQSMLSEPIPLRIGPSDYVEFLENRKVCYIYIRGRYFGGSPVTIDVKLQVWDAPNSAGMIIDVVRAVKLALDRGIGGPLISISAYAFKHPPVQMPVEEAKKRVEEFIRGLRSS